MEVSRAGQRCCRATTRWAPLCTAGKRQVLQTCLSHRPMAGTAKSPTKVRRRNATAAITWPARRLHTARPSSPSPPDVPVLRVTQVLTQIFQNGQVARHEIGKLFETRHPVHLSLEQPLAQVTGVAFDRFPDGPQLFLEPEDLFPVSHAFPRQHCHPRKPLDKGYNVLPGFFRCQHQVPQVTEEIVITDCRKRRGFRGSGRRLRDFGSLAIALLVPDLIVLPPGGEP